MMMHTIDSGHSGHSPSEIGPSSLGSNSLSIGAGGRSFADIWRLHKSGETAVESRGMLPDDFSKEDLVRIMSEGVEDSRGVLNRLCLNQGEMGILDLDDMNVRGKQVWIGYREVCEGNFERFVTAVKSRDPNFVAEINKIAEDQQIPHVAVTSGGTLRQRIFPRAR